MSLASTAPPPASTLSPGFSTASSDLSPCPSEDDQLSTDGGLALALEQPQQKQQQPMEVDADVGPAAAGAGTDQWLMPWFPTSEARGLILHFCQTSGSLLSASSLRTLRFYAHTAPLTGLSRRRRRPRSVQPAARLAPPRDAPAPGPLSPARHVGPGRRAPHDAPHDRRDPPGLPSRAGERAPRRHWPGCRPRRQPPARGTHAPGRSGGRCAGQARRRRRDDPCQARRGRHGLCRRRHARRARLRAQPRARARARQVVRPSTLLPSLPSSRPTS